MPTQAWPYAVTRGHFTGHQAVLVPGFLADAGLTYVLEYASRQETGGPGTATVREVLGAPGPLSVVYRVREARGDRYGLDGGDLLEDFGGRTIRVFEGLVLRLPAAEVASLGLTTRDLDAVARLAAPAFRALWKAETRIEADLSTAMPVGEAAPAAWPLKLRITEPYVIPGSDAERGTPVAHIVPLPGARIRTGDSDAAVRRPSRHDPGVPSRPARDHEPGPPPGVPKGLIAIVAAVVALAVIGWLVSQLFSSPRHMHKPRNQLATTTVKQLCADLSSGKASDAYLEFSPVYRHSTTRAAFDSRLFGSASSAKCTFTTVSQSGDRATLVLQRADGSTGTAHLAFREESNQSEITDMSVSS